MAIKIKGVSGGVDRRGLAKVKGRYLFEDISVDDALVAPLPSRFTSLPEAGREFSEWDSDKSFYMDVTFEGLLKDPTSDEDQYVILPEWREEPIEAFPDMDALVKKWGAYDEGDGRIKFPQYMSGGGTAAGTGLGSSSGSKGERNPLYGTTSYPVLRCVAQHSFVRLRKPANLASSVGDVVKNLPAGFEFSGMGPWIVDVPRMRKRGNAWEIVLTWKSIDNLKHIEALQTLLKKKR